MSCTNCGALLVDGANACFNCGVPFGRDVPQGGSAPMGGSVSFDGSSPGDAGTPMFQTQPPAFGQPAVVGQQPGAGQLSQSLGQQPDLSRQAPAVGQPAGIGQQPGVGQQPLGGPSSAASAFGAPFDSYLSMVAARLEQQPIYVPELWSYVFLTKRFSSMLVNMHQFFILTHNDMCNGATMGQFTNACVDWALRNYKGAVRGMQKGVAVYPVMCQTAANPEVVAFTKEKPAAHFAAFALACSYDLSARRLETLEKTPVWGLAMWRGIRKADAEALA